MANKERNKRSARQARQRERAEREALIAESTPTAAKGKKRPATTPTTKKPVKISAASTNNGLLGRVKGYFREVRGEMRRVTWPNRTELTNYSVAVVAMLIVFGVAVWLIDTGFVAGLVAFTGLRG